MFHARYLLPKLWAKALNYANHSQKRSPHRSVKDQTPFKAWSDRKPEVTHFQIYGSPAWTHVPSDKRKSLDLHSTTCIFVGYPNGVKGYMLFDPSTDRLIIEHNVQFEETPLHALLEPHVDTYVPLPALDMSDDESTH
jgi:hypothetical protein